MTTVAWVLLGLTAVMLTGVVLNQLDIKKQDNYGKDGNYKTYYGYVQS